MDIATLFAALALAALIQGSLLLSRYNRSPESPDLLWSGLGNILVGIGAGLFGARYFGMHYLIYSYFANMCLLTGIAFLVQGVRASDGFGPSWVQLAGPGLIWTAATSLDRFRYSFESAIWLFFLLSFWLAACASTHLWRGGLLLAGRRLWLCLWAFIAVAMALRVVDASNTLPGLTDRYSASLWHVTFLTLCAASAMGVGYINLALSDNLPGLSGFLDWLERGLKSDIKAPNEGQHGCASGPADTVWSLRVDRLFMGRALQHPFNVSDITSIAAEIARLCPDIAAIRRAGIDRLVWVERECSDGQPVTAEVMAEALSAVTSRPGFPAITLSIGAAPARGGDILRAAARADRMAVRIASS